MRRREGTSWTLYCFIGLIAQSQSLAFRRQCRGSPLFTEDASTDCRFTRRKLLQTVGAATPFISLVQSAQAAAPVTQQETDSVYARFVRATRPKPTRLLRSKLNLDFAVMLMRSSYNALDELDCVAMDQFQRDFFLIRQAEYEPYVTNLGPGVVQQGDLTDPFYFDFISFAQYQTIDREITNDPPFVFIEKQPIQSQDENALQQFADIVVKRDPSLRNGMLPDEHSRQVGASIIDWCHKVYGDTPIALPPRSPNGQDADQILAQLSQLVKLFLINGFAWKGDAVLSSGGAVFEKRGTAEYVLTLQSPATLWAGQGLSFERSSLRNDFLLKAARELLRREGYRITESSVKYDGTNELTRITVALL